MSDKAIEWPAGDYDSQATPHREWFEQVVGRLDLAGSEVVLDAGCGTGRWTQLIAERVPDGRVIGVDASPEMLTLARERLGQEVELIETDLTELELTEAVDAVFSSAVFHWIADHDALFARLFAALRPGGRLEAQCGGIGNVAEVERAVESLAGDERFAEYLRTDRQAWNFASVGDTELRLTRAGFKNVEASTEPWQVMPEDPAGYLRAVMLPWHLDRLPEALHEEFVAAVLGSAPQPLVVNYVRLNLSATRPA